MADFNIYEELMPKIQALIAPPDNSNSSNSRSRSSSELPPYVKRRGKRHNHDYCDACGEKGNTLSCDICPASFHLLCHDPPLSGKEITRNCWTCRACQYSQQEEKDKKTTTSSVKQTQSREIEKEMSDVVIPTSEVYHERLSPSAEDITAITPSPETNSTEKTNSHNGNQSLSVDIFQVKEESLEEKNVGSDLDEDEEVVGESNIIKIECDEEITEPQANLKFPLKIEPEVFDNHDSCEESIADSNAIDVNIDDVWKIIGVDKRVEVITEKDDSRKSSNEVNDVHVSDTPSSSKLDKISKVSKNLPVTVNISLPKCDHLLNDYEAKRKVTAEADSKKCLAKKLRRTRAKNSVSKDNEIHVNGIKTAFDSIIRDAAKMNPKQFALPIEYMTNINLNLIGTEKDPDSFPNDLNSSDLLKLPARKCYYCKGTCLTGQMISCDFCPAHFHLNCLNPPLCNIPDVKWMCPLHPHHVLDRVMKNPSSVTELMSWWSRFSAPIDDEDVKSNFISKVKSTEKTPRKRRFIRSSVKIPDIVKYHYKHPPSTVPCLPEVLDSISDGVCENHSTLLGHESNEQLNIRDQNAQRNERNSPIKDSPINANNVQVNTADEKQKNLRPYKKTKWKEVIEVVSDSDPKTSINNNDKADAEFEQTAIRRNNGFVSNGIFPNDGVPEVQKLDNIKKTGVCWKAIENFIIRDINRNFITGGTSVTTLSEDVRRLLMVEKVKQYTQDLPPSFMPNTNPYPLFHPLLKDNMKDALLCRPKSNVRAVLCPLSHRPLVYMYGQSLSIGSGFSNDICLRQYGCCNFISDEHAVIFYDKITNTYELINYSEYNTMVDGVCYTCDISGNEMHKVPNKSKDIAMPTQKPSTRGVKRKMSSSTIPSGNMETRKKAGSTVMAAEARSIYKKLLQDIDKLVSRSQEEMTSIAEEDLNEISKAIKSTPTEQRDRLNNHEKTEKKKVRKNIVKKKCIEANTETANNSSTSAKIPRKKKIAGEPNTGIDEAVVATSPLPSSSNLTRKPCRSKSRTRATFGRKRRRKLGEPRKKKTCSKVTSDDASYISDTDRKYSDGEYELDDHLITNPRQDKCCCRANRVKFPNGHDSSWEKTAPLNHGSYIRFGCIEFIFSIVDYPAPSEERSYSGLKEQPPPPVQPKVEPEELPQRIFIPPTEDDLSLKLISILNVLSSKTSSKSSSPASSPSNVSSMSSPFSSRSSSPIMGNGDLNDEAESGNCNFQSKDRSEDGKIEITG